MPLYPWLIAAGLGLHFCLPHVCSCGQGAGLVPNQGVSAHTTLQGYLFGKNNDIVHCAGMQQIHDW